MLMLFCGHLLVDVIINTQLNSMLDAGSVLGILLLMLFLAQFFILLLFLFSQLWENGDDTKKHLFDFFRNEKKDVCIIIGCLFIQIFSNPTIVGHNINPHWLTNISFICYIMVCLLICRLSFNAIRKNSVPCLLACISFFLLFLFSMLLGFSRLDFIE